MKSFKDKVAVITGGGGNGIGHELVKALASQGAHVAYCDIANLHSTEEAVRPFDIKSHSEIVDMADKQAINQFIDNIIKTFGHIDILINNAGIALGDISFEKITESDFEKITDINYWGVVHTTQRAYPHMLKRPEAALANISSSQGIMAAPYLVPYCTTKFAVRGFTDSLRSEHKLNNRSNFTVHTVHPGRVATNITLNADYQGPRSESFHKGLQKGTSPEKAAQVILNGIKKKESRIFISDGRIQDISARLFPSATHILAKFYTRLFGIKL